MAVLSSSAFCQHPNLDNWYKNIDRIAYSLHATDIIYLKKEVLYNGSIIPVAYGGLSYCGKDSNKVSVPFLYTYGRIEISKEEFERMMLMHDSTKVFVQIHFMPVSISEFQKEIDGYCSVSFCLTIRNFHDLYINRDHLWLCSYWAITARKDCYLVMYKDYSFGGYYYYVPYENSTKKKLSKKIEKLFKKQYLDWPFLLNYFEL